MNERIKELAAQAERQVYPVTSLYNEDSTPRLNSEFEKKFAELIVQECASLFDPDLRDEHEEWVIRKSILNHFGVEE